MHCIALISAFKHKKTLLSSVNFFFLFWLGSAPVNNHSFQKNRHLWENVVNTRLLCGVVMKAYHQSWKNQFTAEFPYLQSEAKVKNYPSASRLLLHRYWAWSTKSRGLQNDTGLTVIARLKMDNFVEQCLQLMNF